jgi:hypothetical protein
MLFGRLSRRSPRPAPPHQGRPIFRPVLDSFEDRVVPASPVLGPALAAPLTIAPTFNFSALQLNVGDVSILSNNNVNSLVGVAQIGNVIDELVLNLTAEDNPLDPDCPILNLELGPIHLDLLGLNVDTSAICLDITAHAGQGLLGDLLCGVANLLNDGISLSDILGGLTAVDPAALVGALNDILGGVFGGLTAADVAGVSGTSPGACDILNLAIGPLDLNLLGLEVELDDCEGGPVTVDVTAEPGPGKLLGNLLCNLSNLLNSNASGVALQNAFDRVADRIGDIIDLNQ